MDTVLALVRSEADRKAFQSGLAKCATIRFCTRREELRAEAAGVTPALLISELRDHDGQSVQPTLWSLHRRRPWLPIYLYIPLATADVQEAFALVRSGIAAGAVFRGADHPGRALRELLTRAQLEGETARLLRAVTSLMPPAVVPIASVCVVESTRAAYLADLASLLDMSPRTVEWQLQRAGLPTPQRLLSWCRLLRAASRLGQKGTSLKSVAAGLHYTSSGALAQHLKRHANVTPAMVRHDGFRLLHTMFAAEVLLGRRPKAPPRRPRRDRTGAREPHAEPHQRPADCG